jgi:hypothetical protein
MSSSPALPEPANDASPNPASQRDEDAQYYRQVLHELVEIGTRLARAIDRQAAPESNAAPAAAPEQAAQPAPAPEAAPVAAPDLTIAFDRVARTIRRTIALARKLSEPAQPSPAERAAAAAEQRRRAARKQIIRDVEDTIRREAHGREAEALHAELYERLDTLDLDDDIENLPIAEIIAAIRRDLGIAAHINSRGISPWKRRRPADVRDLCARAAWPRTAQPRAAQPRSGDPRPIPAPPPRPRTSTGPPRP